MNAKEIKGKSPIEQLVEEWGYPLESGGELRKAAAWPGLVIDVKHQRYTWQDMEHNEEGDVFAFLQAREGWGFREVLNYLAFRADLLPPDRPHRADVPNPDFVAPAEPVQLKPQEQPAGEQLSWSARDIKDHRIKEARALASDFNALGDGIDGVVWEGLRSPVKVLEMRRVFPALFSPVVGNLPDFGVNDCSWCRAEFGDWAELGKAYAAAAIDEEDRLDPSPGGVYCSRCLERFRRWRRAFLLVFSYCFELYLRGAGQRGEAEKAREMAVCDAGAGEENTQKNS